MKSPFSGMDPYLEGALWSEVHHELISKIKRLLIPQLGEKYIARIERYVVQDTHASEDLGIMYPDVEVFKDKAKEPMLAYGTSKTPTPPTLTIPRIRPIEVRIPTLKIIDKTHNQLVTAIEVLSPVNKRKPGLEPYLKKKQTLIDNGIHFLEIDLLRRGKRTMIDSKLANALYLIALTRASSKVTDIWTMDLESTLPTVPVPLISPDPDMLLDVQQAIDEIYVESQFYRSIDYTKAPPPPKILEA